MPKNLQVIESPLCNIPGDVTIQLTCSRHFASVLGYLLQNRTSIGAPITRGNIGFGKSPTQTSFRFDELQYFANLPVETAQRDMHNLLTELKSHQIAIPTESQ